MHESLPYQGIVRETSMLMLQMKMLKMLNLKITNEDVENVKSENMFWQWFFLYWKPKNHKIMKFSSSWKCIWSLKISK